MVKEKYTPNEYSTTELLWSLFASIALLTYGLLGATYDDLYIPGKRGNGIHFQGVSAWIMCVSLLCAAVNLILVIVDQFDRRNNERWYSNHRRLFKLSGYFFLCAALIIDLILKVKG